MTTTLKTFSFASSLELRSIDIDGSPWFVGIDVVRALGCVPTTTSLDGLDDGDKARKSLGWSGSPPMPIKESGLYALILKSRKPTAKVFARWVTQDVLHSIRKTAGYMTPEVAVLAVEGPAVFMARALVIE